MRSAPLATKCKTITSNCCEWRALIVVQTRNDDDDEQNYNLFRPTLRCSYNLQLGLQRPIEMTTFPTQSSFGLQNNNYRSSSELFGW